MSITHRSTLTTRRIQLFFRSDAHLKFNPFIGNQVHMTFYGFARRMMKTFSAEKYQLVCSLRLGKIFEQRFVCAWLEGEEKNIKYHQMAFQCYDIKDVPHSLPNCFPFFSRSRQIFRKSVLAGTFSIVMGLCIHIVLRAVQLSPTLSRPSTWDLSF